MKTYWLLDSDRTAGSIPASGSVSFYLRLFNARHSSQNPREFKLVAAAVSGSWQEGSGLDMEDYSDLTYNNPGSNWINANNNEKKLYGNMVYEYISSINLLSF